MKEQHKGSTAVRAAKRPKLSEGQPWQKLELFPTPPWATRALLECVLPRFCLPLIGSVLEPAAGLGHMASVLAEYVPDVRARDVYLYESERAVPLDLPICQDDFLDAHRLIDPVDWVITNPPFGPAADFLFRAMEVAQIGIAFLLRMQWLESDGRYQRIFNDFAPTLVAQFSERVPMCEGGWDPAASTATAYAWFVWLRSADGAWARPKELTGSMSFFIIPPGQREALTKPRDALLATRFVPGWVPPSTLKKSGAEQMSLIDGASA